MAQVKRNIAVVCTSDGFGGLELNLIKLARWLKERGNHVTYITGIDSRMHKKGLDSDLSPILLKKKSQRYPIFAARKLAKICKEKNIQSLIFSFSRDIDLGVFAKLYHPSLKLYFLQQMEVGVDKKGPVHNFLFSKLEKWITPLPWLKKQLKEKTNIPEEKIAEIPLCIDIDKFFANPLSKMQAREKLEIKTQDILIGIVGRIDRAKGIHNVVEAFSLIEGKFPKAELLIVGEASPHDPVKMRYFEDLKTNIQNSKASTRIHLQDFRPDVENVYRALDVFVMASLAETFGMVTVEAMASGNYVIGTNYGGSADILEHGKLGELFEVDNSNELAHKLKKILSNWDNYKETSHLQEVAKIKYSHHKMCEMIEDLLDKYI